MVTKIRSRVALAVAIIGVVFTLATVILPLVKTHQTAIATGPSTPYGNTDSTFSGYLIPPVDKGSTISIVLTGYAPDSLTFSMFPTISGDLAPAGPPILSLTDRDFSTPIKHLIVVSPDTQAYGIYIESSNRTQFVIAVDGTWTPYFDLRGYTSEGLFATLGGFLAYFYFKHFEFRRSIEEKALAELEEIKKKERENAK
ncbi:MAG: hypothetical protein OK438_04085 [Thaumarchaeota archaeon]|nr:hypothetical protein [Nitrososphaerota archaeon]